MRKRTEKSRVTVESKRDLRCVYEIALSVVLIVGKEEEKIREKEEGKNGKGKKKERI